MKPCFDLVLRLTCKCAINEIVDYASDNVIAVIYFDEFSHDDTQHLQKTISYLDQTQKTLSEELSNVKIIDLNMYDKSNFSKFVQDLAGVAYIDQSVEEVAKSIIHKAIVPLQYIFTGDTECEDIYNLIDTLDDKMSAQWKIIYLWTNKNEAETRAKEYEIPLLIYAE